jgi:hypothetical protein
MMAGRGPQEIRTEDGLVFAILGLGIFAISIVVIVVVLVVSGHSVPPR